MEPISEYARGFADGEARAWVCRHDPLPSPERIIPTEYWRGYWDGRLPRTAEWTRTIRHPMKCWEAA